MYDWSPSRYCSWGELQLISHKSWYPMFTIYHAQCSTVSSAWVHNTQRTLSILIWNSTPCSAASPASPTTSERIMKTNHGEGLQMCTGVHIKCPILIKLEFYWQILVKIPKLKFHENCPSKNWAVLCGQTYKHHETKSPFMHKSA